MLSLLVGIHPTLADFLSAIKNRESPDKKSASVWWALATAELKRFAAIFKSKVTDLTFNDEQTSLQN